MIQSGLIFALGFLVAGFLALMIAPKIWRRAVFLTRKRIESAIPLTANELQADKDKLRAEHAMALRRVEILVEKLRAKSTLDAQTNVQQAEEIKLLKADLASQSEVNVNLDHSISATNQKLSESELEVQDVKLQLSTTSAELAARTGQLESLTRLHQEAQKKISDDERKLAEFEIDVAKLKSSIEDLKERRRKDQEKVRDTRAESQATAELLKNEKARSAETEKKFERAVADLSDIEVKLARLEKARERSKEKQEGLEADLQELEQRLSDSVDERKSIEKELGDITLRYNKVVKSLGSEDPDKAIAALQSAQAKLEKELAASIDERDKLLKENKEKTKAGKKSNADDGDAELREELAQLAAEVVQMAALVEGEGSRINSLIENAGKDDGATMSLASRVKALKEMASKSAN